MNKEFNDWLDALVDEKEFDREYLFEWDGNDETYHFMSLGTVLAHLKGLKPEFQENIREKIARIDLYNGDMLHFFKYLAKGIAF